MEFHGMKRKDLQALCKKHGIPANLKNDEMACRLASVFKKKPDDSVEIDVVKASKKVSFSPELEVFEFTRSVKKLKQKSVKSRKKVSAQDLQHGVIELRRSKRTVSKGITVAESKTRRKTVEIEKESNLLDDAAKTQNVPRRSKRIGSNGSIEEGCNVPDLMAREQFEDKDLSKGLSGRRSKRLAVNGGASSKEVTLLPAKRSKRHVVTKDKEDELVKNGSYKAAGVVEGSLVGKKTNETLFKSSRRVTRMMKRDRSTEPELEIETASIQGSSKKSKTMSQECIENKTQGIIEVSPSSSETEAAESVMVIENVLDSTPEKSADSSQKTNTQELNSELMEVECEEKLERDTVLMAVIEEEKKEVSSHSASVQLAVSSPQAELLPPTGHIIHKDIASTMTVEENTKDETVVSTPRSELKEHKSVAKLAKVEATLESSVECWKEIHSRKEDEKGSIEKEVQGANLHGNFSECNTENNNAEEETEICKVGLCVSLTPEKLLGELESEEAGGSSKKMKTVNQEVVKVKHQEMADVSPFTSETKATEPVMVSENVLDFTLKVSVDISRVRSTQELSSELMERERENNHEEDSALIAGTKKDQEEASSLSEFVTESSEVKTCPDNSSTGCDLFMEMTPRLDSIQSAMNNPEAELGMPTGHTLVKDSVSTVITEEDIKAKEETFIFTHRSEFKEHISVSKLAKAEGILKNSAKCCKETHSSNDDEKGSLEKDLPAETLHGMFFEYDTENSSAEEEIKTLDQECLKDKPQRMVEGSPFTSETEATESVMIYENVLGSSVHISSKRNIQELNLELTEGEREEKHEQDTLVMVTVKEKEEPSTISVSLNEGSKVSNPEAELGVPNSQILDKDVGLTVVSEEDIETKEGSLVSTLRPEQEEHSFVAKLAETEDTTVLQNPSELWEDIHSSKDDARDSLEKDLQATNLHENFSECNTESAEEQAEISGVNLQTRVKVNEDRLENSERTISSETDCKLNVELSRSSPIDFASASPNKENISECFEKDEMEALSQPSLLNKADTSSLDESAVFTTPERNLLLMEQLSGNEKTCATETANHHNDEAVDSCNVVFTTLKQVSLTKDAVMEEVGNEDEPAATCEVAESCSVVSGESSFHNALEELAVTGGFVLAGTEEHLDCNPEVDFRGTCVEDKATVSIATAFAADEEMTERETTPSPEQTLNESCENKEEELSIDEPSKLLEKQVRREPVLIYRTQVKPKRHDMKENTHNSKIVDNLNVTAPRTSKRQVRREPVLIYRTQVKPKRHDMKENTHNSKIVDNLNVTAPRTSKRQPLQDLK